MLILLVLFVVAMFLWLVSIIPAVQRVVYASNVLAWFAVLFLALLTVPGLRGGH